MRPITCLVLLLAPVLDAAAGEEEDVLTVRMAGRAEGTGQSARTAAIEDAQQEVMGAMLRALGLSDLKAMRPVLRRAGRYIQSYDLLRHDSTGDTTRVEIDAQVLERPFRQDVAAIMLPRLPEPPRVLLLLGERIGTHSAFTIPEGGAAETELRERLDRLGLTVSGAASVRSRCSAAALKAAVLDEGGAGRRFAVESLADVAVIGTAVTASESQPDGSTLVRNTAEVTLRVFRGFDGKMTDVLAASAVVRSVHPHEGGEQAVRDACAKLVADTLVASVITVLGTQAPDTLILTVKGHANRSRLYSVLRTLKSSPFVGAVEEVFCSDALARYRVAYDGPMLDLVDLLTPGVYEGRPLEVEQVIQRNMILFFP